MLIRRCGGTCGILSKSISIETRLGQIRKYASSVPQSDQASIQSTPPQSGKGAWQSRPFRFAVLLGLFGAGSYFLGSIYPPESILLLYPRPTPPLPLPETAEAEKYKERLDKELVNLPHVRSLLASRSVVKSQTSSSGSKNNQNPATYVNAKDGEVKAHYVLSRPFANFPAHMIPYSLTAGSLRKPGMLCVPPVVVSKTRHGAEVLGGNRGDAFAFVHLGRNLCGHDGIVHGGLLATVLDETLARTSFFHLPHQIGVTAHLEIDYKKPVKADSVVVVETKLIEHEGRKAWVEATMTDLRGRILVQSKALFVEPRLVAFLDTSAVRKVMDQSDE
ncbi:hypothetical protein L7F22_030667 [Adiantum nelumboides]|nr:hypothetical protein [Adiantum nelumboides]